jgi:hypothetical protein
MPFMELNHKIATFHFRGNIVKAMTEGVFSAFQQAGNASYVKDIFRFFNSRSADRLPNAIKAIICKDIGDRDPHIELEKESLSNEEMQATTQNRATPSPASGQEQKKEKLQTLNFDVGEQETVIDSELILAPMQGKPLNTCQTGEEIFIRIIGSDDKAKYFIDVLEAHDPETNGVKPLKGKITQIQSIPGGDFGLLVELAPGILAKCVEESNVKVKTTANSDSGTTETQPAQANKDNTTKTKLDLDPPTKDNNKSQLNMPLIFGLLAIIAFITVAFVLLFLTGLL